MPYFSGRLIFTAGSVMVSVETKYKDLIYTIVIIQ